MPGVQVNITDTPMTAGVQADTGKWLVAGEAERGSTTVPALIRSLSEFVRKCGDRVTYGFLYDAADAFFHSGGTNLYVTRVVGPAATSATHTFNDSAGTPAPALTVTANSPGGWGASVSVAIAHVTGGFQLTITYNGVQVETSPVLADVPAAVAWSPSSQYVTLTDPGATGIPAAVAATALAGGTDDRASITTAQWTSALATFGDDLGPGQLSAPGITTVAVQQAVIDRAAATGRVAYVDLEDDSVVGTLTAAVTSLTGEGRKHVGVFAPWAVVPGVTSGTTRTVPYSAVQAGLTAVGDGPGDPPNLTTAIAGDNGFADYALGLSQAFTPTDRETLNAAGINAARIHPSGRVQTYGDRTLADEETQRAWLELTSARLFMYVYWQGNQISQHYVFQPLDPENKTINRYGAELEALLRKLAAGPNGSMIFNDPATAVDVGPSQNTPYTIAARELHGAIAVQPTEAAETVVLNVGAIAP